MTSRSRAGALARYLGRGQRSGATITNNRSQRRPMVLAWRASYGATYAAVTPQFGAP